MVKCFDIVLALARLLTQREYIVASRYSRMNVWTNWSDRFMRCYVLSFVRIARIASHIFSRKKKNEYFFRYFWISHRVTRYRELGQSMNSEVNKYEAHPTRDKFVQLYAITRRTFESFTYRTIQMKVQKSDWLCFYNISNFSLNRIFHNLSSQNELETHNAIICGNHFTIFVNIGYLWMLNTFCY